MKKETKKLSDFLGFSTPFIILIAYCLSVRITDNYTVANYIAVITSLLIMFNRNAIVVGNVFIILVFSFSLLYGGHFLDRHEQATVADIVYVIIITILNIIMIVCFLEEESGDGSKRNIIFFLSYFSIAIAVFRVMLMY